MIDLTERLQPGKSFRFFFGKGNPNNKLYHVRAVVDEEKIVTRRWSRRRGWVYEVKDLYLLTLLNESDRLK